MSTVICIRLLVYSTLCVCRTVVCFSLIGLVVTLGHLDNNLTQVGAACVVAVVAIDTRYV